MSETASKRFFVRAKGPLACFTRPEMKVERVSYEVMTPSAARGILEAVLWKPAIVWRVHEIAVLAEIRWTSFRRNEVSERMSPRVVDYCADEKRTQRHTVALRDVDYVITASFSLTDKAGPDETLRKFEEMFERRLEKGQHFHQPYLGCREFAAEIEPAGSDLQPHAAQVDRPLGRMFYDFAFAQAGTVPLFFEARLQGGVLHVPRREELLNDASEVRP